MRGFKSGVRKNFNLTNFCCGLQEGCWSSIGERKYEGRCNPSSNVIREKYSQQGGMIYFRDEISFGRSVVDWGRFFFSQTVLFFFRLLSGHKRQSFCMNEGGISSSVKCYNGETNLPIWLNIGISRHQNRFLIFALCCTEAW